ncbi:MAG: type II toxin-antitoxin system VapC family toxin [Acidobacteriota bacterium]|nr:type II toxin-antitoxin system VapC family toxin [Acidobacteriota bacterium]MDH3522779.1 type II toxin-antitoxin system VapC family toxin [Acidobacteriota bacterium]
MILVDANLLIYAIDADSPLHRPARRWLEETLSGTTRVGLAWIVALAFVRLTTRAGIVGAPLPPEAALAYVDSWLDQPFVTAVAPGARHWPIFRNLTLATGTAGNLTSDAHLAALAIEHGCAVYSTDNDFKRFAGIEHVNPLA